MCGVSIVPQFVNDPELIPRVVAIVHARMVLDYVGIERIGGRADDRSTEVLSIILLLRKYFNISSRLEILVYVRHRVLRIY